MKKNVLVIAGFLFVTSVLQAQWCVLEDDPRVYKSGGISPAWNVFTREQWNASNFASTKDMQWFNDARYGMFISYGLSSYVHKDLSWPIVYDHKAPDPGHGKYPDSAWQITWPSQWKMEKFNAREWVQIAKDAGMKYMVIIVKHHDGFHMWDTKFSDFKITNTPFGHDYLKELADACHRMKMPLGIYYSQRDWYHPYYEPVDTNKTIRLPKQPFYQAKPGQTVSAGPNHNKYIEYQYNVIRELLTNYGKVDVFWFDAAWSGGMYTADMWDAENLTRMMRKLQPHIIINNRNSLPGDFDTPEQTIGMYQRRPWESAMTMNGVWAFDPSHPNKPVKKLIQEMLQAASGNGNILLSWGASFDGQFDKGQKDTLLAVGSWLKKYGNYYYATKGGPWMPTRKYGTVYKGNEVYVYVSDWENASLQLKELTENKVLNATFINLPEKLQWKKEKGFIQFEKPTTPDAIVTLIKLTMQKPISESDIMTGPSNIFDNPAYGKKYVTKTVNKSNWQDSTGTIDLQLSQNVTIVNIFGLVENARVEVSTDASTWQDVGLVRPKMGILLLTTEMSGAEVPGKKLRYLRLKTKNPQEVQVEFFVKQ